VSDCSVTAPEKPRTKASEVTLESIEAVLLPLKNKNEKMVIKPVDPCPADPSELIQKYRVNFWIQVAPKDDNSVYETVSKLGRSVFVCIKNRNGILSIARQDWD